MGIIKIHIRRDGIEQKERCLQRWAGHCNQPYDDFYGSCIFHLEILYNKLSALKQPKLCHNFDRFESNMGLWKKKKASVWQHCDLCRLKRYEELNCVLKKNVKPELIIPVNEVLFKRYDLCRINLVKLRWLGYDLIQYNY